MKTATKSTTKSTTKATAAKTSATKAAQKSTAAKTAKSANKAEAKSDAAAGLKELFVDCLKDIYWAEKALYKTLPKMSKNATTQGLKDAIDSHTTETENHVKRLEQAFEMIGKKATAKKCEAMAGLLKEGEDILESTEPGPVRDAGIIAASQKIEHYEIATYGTICAFAKTLGHDDVAKLLHETLKEEKLADQSLTDNAYNSINFDAQSNGAE